MTSDSRPQPWDGPEYHTDLAFWLEANRSLHESLDLIGDVGIYHTLAPYGTLSPYNMEPEGWACYYCGLDENEDGSEPCIGPVFDEPPSEEDRDGDESYSR